jgi:hypothetical protein
MSFNICIPLIYSGSDQLMCCKQNPFSVGALNNLQPFLDCLEPIIDIHWLDGVRECQRLSLLEFSKFVMLLRLWHWMLPLSMLHVRHSLLRSIWACMINTCFSVGSGGGLALLLSLFSLVARLRVLAI